METKALFLHPLDTEYYHSGKYRQNHPEKRHDGKEEWFRQTNGTNRIYKHKEWERVDARRLFGTIYGIYPPDDCDLLMTCCLKLEYDPNGCRYKCCNQKYGSTPCKSYYSCCRSTKETSKGCQQRYKCCKAVPWSTNTKYHKGCKGVIEIIKEINNDV
eukprot:UN10186